MVQICPFGRHDGFLAFDIQYGIDVSHHAVINASKCQRTGSVRMGKMSIDPLCLQKDLETVFIKQLEAKPKYLKGQSPIGTSILDF